MNTNAYYEMTLTALQQQLEEMDEYTESALCEILGTDAYYYPVYNFNHYEVASGEVVDYIGFFLIALQDGPVFMPFEVAQSGDGFEQLVPHHARYLNQDDEKMLADARRWLQRSTRAIETTLERLNSVSND